MDRPYYQSLRIYSLSESLADRLWEIVEKWQEFPRTTLGKQLVRAADSVGANIAEGSGRGSIGETRRFALIARGSLFEVRHWLRRACRRHLLSEAEQLELQEIINNLTPQLNSYVKSKREASSK